MMFEKKFEIFEEVHQEANFFSDKADNRLFLI